MIKGNERGSAILLVLVILLSVSILCVSSMNISGYDSTITGNFKSHEITFNLTDGTLNAATILISDSIAQNEVPTAFVTNGFMTTVEAETLFRQLEGFDAYDPAADIKVKYGTEIGDNTYIIANVDVSVDVNRLAAKSMKGSSLKFGMGGSGFNSGTAVAYLIDGQGSGTQQSQSNIEAVYYKVLGP